MPVVAPLHTAPTFPWERPGREASLRTVGLLAGAIALLIDQATKQLAATQLLPLGTRRELPGPLTLRLTYNDGGAFGTPGPWWFFLVVTLVVTVIVLHNLPQVRTVTGGVAYGLLLAGAWGNALDRVFRSGDPGDPRFLHGHVVDFLASAKLPTFNIADVAIVAGFVLLIVSLIREGAGEGAAIAEPV